jgi:hypothetical protein
MKLNAKPVVHLKSILQNLTLFLCAVVLAHCIKVAFLPNH